MGRKSQVNAVSVVPGPRIPFNRPLHLDGELQAIQAALESGQLAGGGAYARRCEHWAREYSGAPVALMVSSCTHALEMSAMLMGISPGDEVIMPSYSFVSTANAFVMHGAVPVFVDISPDTCNLDPQLIERAITSRTKAIVPVHYAGVACDMDAILDIAQRHRLAVVEDAAHAVMATWKGKALGSIGDFGAFSFHETKNFTSGGEGGMLLIRSPESLENAEVIREKGTDRASYMRGRVTEYVWRSTGSSYLASEIQAAALSVQLHSAEHVTRRRLALWQRYFSALSEVAPSFGVRMPHVPDHCEHNAHIFYVIMPSGQARDRIQAALTSAGIVAQTHYRPLHLSPAGKRMSRFEGSDTNTVSVAGTLLRLPLYFSLTDHEQDYVIEKFIEALRQLG